MKTHHIKTSVAGLMTFLTLLFSPTGNAAKNSAKEFHHKSCIADEYNERHKKENPGFARNLEKSELHVKNFEKKWGKEYRQAIDQAKQELLLNGESLPNSSGDPSVFGALLLPPMITIPVVVHVVYNPSSPADNISDAQIQSQIDALNEDFRLISDDYVNPPSNLLQVTGAFQTLASDPQIEFVLAKRDPQGNASNGITRTQTTVTTFPSDNSIKYDSTGGKSAWPRDQYLNIWVGRLSSGLGGYAQYPGGSASTDGVVVTTSVFGRTSNVAAPYNKGRVTTHEVGHWLNLRHIFGNSACGDDLVADTPTQEGNNFFCPAFPKISVCNGISNAPNGDMFNNHMDYTFDNCKNMFSHGQSSRMAANFVVGGPRAPLMSSLGGIAPNSNLPISPSNVMASAISSSQINLTWSDNSSNETGFKIERSLDDTFQTGVTLVSTTGANVISYSNTGLQAGTKYNYRIKSFNSYGDSTWSSVVSATTIQNVPTAPTNLAGSAVSGTQINLTWTDASTNETGFKIERATNSSFTSNLVLIATTAANVTSYNNSNLNAGTTYYYRVRATNAIGDSANSNTAMVATLSPPPAPSNLVAVANSSTSISLSWINNTSNVSSLNIQKSSDGINFTTRASSSDPSWNSFTDTQGITAGSTWYYRIQAYHVTLGSSYSNVATVTTPGAGTVPAAPSNLQALAISYNQVNLTWADNSNNETGFKIERSINGTSNFSQIALVGSNVSSYSDSTVSGSTIYYYRIRATNAYGDSAYSNNVNVSTPSVPPTAPIAPSSLNLTALSYNQVTISWIDNSNNESGFKIERSVNSGTFSQINTVSANITTYTDTTVSPLTSYKYRIRAYNSGGDSAYSNELSVNTPSSVSLPAAPTGLLAVAVSSSQINLTWLDNSSNESGFKIERSTGGGAYTQIATTAANVTSFSSTSLASSTTYIYRIRAFNSDGDSAYSNAYSATTQSSAPIDTTSPVVSILSPSNNGTIPKRQTITISASATDNVGVTRVEFYVNGSLKCSDTSGPYNCAWKVPGAKNASYTIEVRAYDTAGNMGKALISVISN